MLANLLQRDVMRSMTSKTIAMIFFFCWLFLLFSSSYVNSEVREINEDDFRAILLEEKFDFFIKQGIGLADIPPNEETFTSIAIPIGELRFIGKNKEVVDSLQLFMPVKPFTEKSLLARALISVKKQLKNAPLVKTLDKTMIRFMHSEDSPNVIRQIADEGDGIFNLGGDDITRIYVNDGTLCMGGIEGQQFQKIINYLISRYPHNHKYQHLKKVHLNMERMTAVEGFFLAIILLIALILFLHQLNLWRIRRGIRGHLENG